MIYNNDSDYEAIKKVQTQLDAHEFLVDPDDIRALIKRFEMLLEDYVASTGAD